VDDTAPDRQQRVRELHLDRLSAMLTEGASITACLKVLSQADVNEALLTSLGRLFVNSDFRV